MIDPVSSGNGAPPSGPRNSGAAETPAVRPAPAGGTPGRPLDARDLVVRSPVARLEAEAAARPPVDSARVDMLREAVRSGAYRIDAERIADAMLAMEASATPPRNR